ncbi:hypothetical protein D3C85_1762810 [compost metagenome]
MHRLASTSQHDQRVSGKSFPVVDADRVDVHFGDIVMLERELADADHDLRYLVLLVERQPAATLDQAALKQFAESGAGGFETEWRT